MSQPGRRVKPAPIETTTRSSRRFATQPVEISSKSTRTPGLSSDPTPPRRKFVPQPFEISHTSSKNNTKDEKEPAAKPKRRFAPQLVEESTTIQRKHVKSDNTLPEPPASEANDCPATSLSAVKPTRRKFAPQLIETAQRSRKASDTKPALLPSDKTDAHSSQDTIPYRRPDVHITPVPPPPLNTPNPSSPVIPLSSTAEARRLGIPLPKRTISRDPIRQHSFRVPVLDPIESSESDKSDSESLSTSLSSSTDMSSSFRSYAHATRIRESIDDSSAGYLLELAAKAAERQLREQALAAFPNDDRHTPVTHYIDRDSDGSTVANSRMGTGQASSFDRRDSGFKKTDVQYAEMRRYQEKCETEWGKENVIRETRKRKMMQQQHHNGNSSPWANPLLVAGAPKDLFAHDIESDVEMARMRARARPPMLGTDLHFPRCESPEPARFDVTQGCWSARNALCHFTQQNENTKPEGLWYQREDKGKRVVKSRLSTKASSRASSRGGLWGGFCTEGDAALGFPHEPSGPTGLMTPMVVSEENLRELGARGDREEETPRLPFMRGLPPSPPPSNSGMASLDEKLELELEKEKSIELEFDDTFVTQVYNYLSLGYPSMARRYDAELSKISHIPIVVLRRDDELPSARGYIRLGEDDEYGGANVEGIKEVDCWRWKALRLYVKEWARQQPFMNKREDIMGGFGVAIRRGSWAW